MERFAGDKNHQGLQLTMLNRGGVGNGVEVSGVGAQEGGPVCWIQETGRAASTTTGESGACGFGEGSVFQCVPTEFPVLAGEPRRFTADMSSVSLGGVGRVRFKSRVHASD